MTTFDLDIYIRIDTVKSKTIISAHDLDEITALIKYTILAIIGCFLSIIDDKVEKMIGWSEEPIAWSEIGLFFIWQIFSKAIAA